MKVAIVTTMYNEETLAPLFLQHYNWADEIHVLYDTDTTDKTRDILVNRAIIHDLTFPDMMDAGIKQQSLNNLFNSLDADWGIMVDADEFVFAPNCSVREFLSIITPDVHSMSAWLWNVYRYMTDDDIDINRPPLYQRRHGDPDFSNWYNKHYIKRCIARPESKINFNIGCHDFTPRLDIPHLIGTHWKMADPKLAIQRRITNGKLRQSKMNLSQNWQCHDFNITEEEILRVCYAHQWDPQLF